MAGSASLLWSIAGLVGLVTVAPKLDEAVGPAPRQTAGFAIERAPDGQFYADAKIGEAMVRMMVDPRADKVLLSGDDARILGIASDARFTPVTLERLSVGPYSIDGVEAVVAPDLPVSLLGRSYLARLKSVAVERERMILD